MGVERVLHTLKGTLSWHARTYGYRIRPFSYICGRCVQNLGVIGQVDFEESRYENVALRKTGLKFFQLVSARWSSLPLRVLLLSKLKKQTIFKYLKKNYFIYNYNFFHTLLTMF